MTVTDSVKEILSTALFVEVPPAEMGEDDNLRDMFGLDSLGFLELRAQCQERFGVVIPDDEFTPDNFDTIRTVVAMVERLGLATRPVG
jgi:acyl carrier protein